ncbi:type IV secretion protein Rhs [Marivirga lumbricoides]|uniref:Type IV secretion protein Rhs n=1 Tax=Marivirga lumbricoides TaxID=1046115 RepID=A0ABQ1MU86_9BACT|nr:type IV secretion protein Rhs [Marivirga lumbricoides]
MALQPNLDKSLITYSVSAGGSIIDGTFAPISIRVSKEINKIPSAQIEFYDGSPADNEDFKISHSSAFKPGTEITINCGYESEEQVIFKGIVTKHQLKIRNGSAVLQIECKDKALKMTYGRKNEIYQKKKDSDIISDLIKNNGLQGKVEATEEQIEEIVQHYTSDWDFMMLRADINNLVAIVNDGEVNVVKPKADQAPLFDVDYGTNLYDFDAEMDVKNQYNEISVVGWDPNNQEIIEVSSKQAPEIQHGNQKSSDLAKVLGNGKATLQTGGKLSVASLTAWGNSMLLRSRLAKIRGNATIRGDASVKPNTIINFSGISNTFNGKAYVSGVYHIIEEGDWKTELQIGLKERWFAEDTPGIEAPNAAGLNSGMQGLQVAIVKKINEDPAGEYRIQVTIPTLKKDNLSIWARLSNFYSTKESGLFFMPEIGDEVVLGFLNNDPQFPIILGSVYSAKNKPNYTPTDKNEIKSLLTKSKLEIQFNDEDKIITISTPGGHKVIMDDKEKALTVMDEANKNSIIMSDKGITIEAEKDIIFKAKGNISMESKGKTEIKATQDFASEGMNVTLKGKTKFAAEGAQAELKGSAMTTIKGGIVQIN